MAEPITLLPAYYPQPHPGSRTTVSSQPPTVEPGFLEQFSGSRCTARSHLLTASHALAAPR